jgi:hypothetical protein
MLDKSRLSVVAELIRDHITLDGIEQYCSETGVCQEDFVAIRPQGGEGEIFAVDGSNVAVCDWSVANLNFIRAGYAVYRGREWQRSAITYDDVFLADPRLISDQFAPHLERLGQEKIDLKESDLDRLSTYFRELQEYVALNEAILEAHAGDLILYDGSFDIFEPLRGCLNVIFERAETKGAELLAVSKSSTFSWGEGITLPFLQHTSYAGSLLAPGLAWYLSLKDKAVDQAQVSDHGRHKWDGETFIVRFDGDSDRAFRVDAPSYLSGRIASVLGAAAANSCSAECLGYPHALFRAHRDIRISSQEGGFLRLRLMEMLEEMGMSHSQVRMLMQDFHDVLEMRPKI